MKKIFLYTVLGILVSSCRQRETLDMRNEELKATTKATDGVDFRVNVDSGDFKTIKHGDSIFYVRQLYEGLGGRDILFDNRLVKDINVKMKIDFGVLQYTNDDNPAYPLTFSYESKWWNLTTMDNVIEIPDFYNNGNSKKIFEILGFDNDEALSSFIQGEKMNIIKPESIKEQTNFYTTIIKNREKYESCCKEYIAQAERFLNSDKDTLDTFNDLGLELTYNRLIIDIQGQLYNGDGFHSVIIETANP